MSGIGAIAMIIAACLGVVFAILAMIYILVPLVKGIGWLITAVFKSIGWLVMHIFEYIGGTISDVLRFVGALLAMLVLAPLAPLNVVIGRWSAAGHFAESVKRECKVAILCMYRIALQRPLKLVYLHGILEGLEQRVPEAFAATPTRDTPTKRTGQFEGFTIVGSLRGGGSGGKLYIAEPDARKQSRYNMPDRVVIKSFAISDGSSLPQIVRESRALEAAKQLGLVLEHGMEEHRFWYVMPYLPGEHLGVLTRQMHGESGENGLARRHLQDLMVYGRDLLETLARYHDGGLWHKDVKPENIIINTGRAHLVDLGLVTPLRSAMTLTTHGTEYFRDPEMVRQALRGVKVHQVNGAKFDIYAAGAVLYFVLENTFPAHGGLSRFAKRSPEALRWIIRRAMAEYNKRYDSVDTMLADLDVVMKANDPFTVKPVDLPSMTGNDIEYDRSDYEEPEVIGVRAAGSPKPPPDGDERKAYGFGVEFGRKGVRVGRLHPDGSRGAQGQQIGASRPVAGPKLRVMNWWTGQYDLDPQAVAGAHRGSSHAQFRQAADDFRRESDDLRDKVRSGVMTARQAAREQIKSARQRAKHMRQRAHDRRKSVQTAATSRARAERQPSLALIGITTVILLAAIGGGIAVVKTIGNSGGASVISTGGSASVDRPPVLVINNHPAPDTSRTREDIKSILDRHDQYHLVLDDMAAMSEIIPLYLEWRPQWGRRGSRVDKMPIDKTLENALEHHNYYGILYITDDEDGDARSQFVYSTREGAERRRHTTASNRPKIAAGQTLQLLLLNDHPAKMNIDIAQRVNDIIAVYEQNGFAVRVDDDVEASVRAAGLPLGPLDEMRTPPVRVERLLIDHGYAGILRMTADESDESVKASDVFIDSAFEAEQAEEESAETIQSSVRIIQSHSTSGSTAICTTKKAA